MDMMDNDRNSRAVRGDPAHYSCLAAVRMDDLWLAFPEKVREVTGGAEIKKRMNRTDERRQERKKIFVRGHQRFHRAFRAGGGAGDQVHLDIGFLAKTKNCRDRVLLSAADNQAGDYVSHPHHVLLQLMQSYGCG
jgi:hypothetical protein